MKTLCALVLALVPGAVCVYCAAALLDAVGTPALFVNFTRKADSPAMPLYFHNTGKTEITLDAEGMRPVLFHPANGGERYILHLASAPLGASGAENARRARAGIALQPGESAEIGDMRAVIMQLPDADLSLTAVYPGGAQTRGVKSLPLILRKEGR
jgi:hypothetical protein